jgi:hypothetical protein
LHAFDRRKVYITLKIINNKNKNKNKKKEKKDKKRKGKKKKRRISLSLLLNNLWEMGSWCLVF